MYHNWLSLFPLLKIGWRVYTNEWSFHVCLCLVSVHCFTSIQIQSHVYLCLVSTHSFTWSHTFFSSILILCCSFTNSYSVYLQRIAQLLHQIAQMNEILIGRHKALIGRHKALAAKVAKWLSEFCEYGEYWSRAFVSTDAVFILSFFFSFWTTPLLTFVILQFAWLLQVLVRM